MNALPNPTKTRLQLARDIRDRQVLEYLTETPSFTHSKAEDRIVTARVDEFVAAGLATRDTEVRDYFKVVALTPSGALWLEAGLNRDIRPLPEGLVDTDHELHPDAGNRWIPESVSGPGSTSPEPFGAPSEVIVRHDVLTDEQFFGGPATKDGAP